MFIKHNKKAQATAEYAIIIGVVIAALIAMQTYVKRGLNSKIQQATDHTYSPAGSLAVTFDAGQYEPYYASSNFTTTRSTGQEQESTFVGGSVQRNITDDVVDRTGNQTEAEAVADPD
jgi:uncharacterized protein (UPF0333 family)